MRFLRRATALTMALAAGLAAAPVGAAGPGLKLEAVVVLTRHGVRPPTKAEPMPAGFAADPWPVFPVNPGWLTPHGAKAMTVLGHWDRRNLAARGLLPAKGCPAPGTVDAWADTDQRTIASAEAWAQGLAPGCPIAVGRASGDQDPLFSPIAAGVHSIDPVMAEKAVRDRLPAGGLPELQARFHDRLKRLGDIYGCCKAPVCPDTATACRLEDMPTGVEGRVNNRPRLTGGMDYASTAAQILLLEYADGRPMSEVGWGRVTAADITVLGAFHAAEFDLLARPPYVAARNITPIAKRMLKALEAGPGRGAKVTLLLGHDTNVASLGGLLDLHWTTPGNAADDPSPGGTLGFERLRDGRGKVWVRAFYQAQTLEQLRKLTPLSDKAPPFRRYLPIPGCSEGPDQSCPMAGFAQLMTSRFAD